MVFVLVIGALSCANRQLMDKNAQTRFYMSYFLLSLFCPWYCLVFLWNVAAFAAVVPFHCLRRLELSPDVAPDRDLLKRSRIFRAVT